MSRDAGSGYVHELVVRTILDGQRTTEEIRVVLKGYIAGDGVLRVLSKMEHRHWIGRSQWGWHVLEAGKRCLPGYVMATPAWAKSVYRPPTPPPRREGSDWTVFPSVAAGVERGYVRHV